MARLPETPARPKQFACFLAGCLSKAGMKCILTGRIAIHKLGQRRSDYFTGDR